jgi:hypothetical protein
MAEGSAMKIIQVIPKEKMRLYGAMVKKELDIRRSNRGTFSRVGSKKRNESKWKHAKFKGRVNLERGLSEVVTIEINSRAEGEESQLLVAFLGWLDRHFNKEILTVNIHYRE